MKKLIFALSILVLSSFSEPALANCTGIFQANEICGATTRGIPSNALSVGTSGHKLPFLDGNNIWSGTNTFPSPVGASDAAIKSYVDGKFPVSVANGGTGATSFTANLPLIGSGTSAIALGSRSGNTTTFATATGTLTNGHCVSIDGDGNFVDAGGACTTGGGGGTITSATSGQVAVYTGTSPSTTVGGVSTIPTGTVWGGAAIPLAKGGTAADLSGAAANTIPVFPGSAGAATAKTASGWFDSAYCNTVGYIVARTTGAWTCSSALQANPVWWGADPTGVSDSSAAFQSMLNAGVNNIGCNGKFKFTGTVTIPGSASAVLYLHLTGNGLCDIVTTSASGKLFSYVRTTTNFPTYFYINNITMEGPATGGIVGTNYGTSVGIEFRGVCGTATTAGCTARYDDSRLEIRNTISRGFYQAIYTKFATGYLDNVNMLFNGYSFFGGYDASVWWINNTQLKFGVYGLYFNNSDGWTEAYSGGGAPTCCSNDAISEGILINNSYGVGNANTDLTFAFWDAVQVYGGGFDLGGSGTGAGQYAMYCQGCSNVSVVATYLSSGAFANRNALYFYGVNHCYVAGNQMQTSNYGFALLDLPGPGPGVNAPVVSDYCHIVNNRSIGNTNAGGIVTAGTHNVVTDNSGYNPVGGFGLSLTNGVPYVNGPTPAEISLTANWNGTSVFSMIRPGGAYACANTAVCTFTLGPNESVTPSFSGSILTAQTIFIH